MSVHPKLIPFIIVFLVCAYGLAHWHANNKPKAATDDTNSLTPIHERTNIDDHAEIAQHGDVSTNLTDDRQPGLKHWRSTLKDPGHLERVPKHEIDMSVPFGRRLEGLRRQALAGDPVAAVEIATSLGYCATAPANEQSLAEKINHTYQTLQVDDNVYPTTDLDGAIQSIRDQYRYCAGIDRDQFLDHYVYARMAAENGSLEAMVRGLEGRGLYQDDFWEAYRRAWPTDEDSIADTLRFTAEAANAGSASAIFRRGHLLSRRGESASRVEAAAHTIAGAHVLTQTRTNRELFERELVRTFNSLSVSEAEEALLMANEIISRENCCFVYE